MSIASHAEGKELGDLVHRIVSGQHATITQGREQGVHVTILVLDSDDAARRLLAAQVAASEEKDKQTEGRHGSPPPVTASWRRSWASAIARRGR